MSGLKSIPTRAECGPRLLLGLDRLLGRLETGLLAIACTFILAIMLLVSADAVARYLFDSPIGFTFDLVTEYLMPASLFLALAFTLRRGGHVNVDLFVEFLPTRARQLLTGLLVLTAFPIVWFMAWEGAFKTWHSWRAGDVTTGVYAWPIWVSEIIVPIGFGLLVARIAHVAVGNLHAALIGDHSTAVPIAPSRNTPPEDAI